MSLIAWLALLALSLLAVISVVLVFLHHEWLTQLRNRVTVWRWTEMSERARLNPRTVTPADRRKLKELQDDLQRYKRYPGRSRRQELLQRLTALRVLAYGPNSASRYEALQELASIISALSEDLEPEVSPAELPYRHIVHNLLVQLYPGMTVAETRSWAVEKYDPPTQKQLVEILAAVVFCLTAHIDGRELHPLVSYKDAG